MNDPRIILKDKLIETGFASPDALIIALDAGSSQVRVSKKYLSKFNNSEEQKEKALKCLKKFYKGEYNPQD